MSDTYDVTDHDGNFIAKLPKRNKGVAMSTVDPAGKHSQHNEPAKTIVAGGKKAPKKWQVKLAGAWKAIVALVGALLILLNTLVGLNFWSERTLDWISTGIAGLTAAAVFFKANQRRAEQITDIDIDEDHVEG